MNNNRTITVVIREPVQVGPDEWRMVSTSRNFSGSRTIDDILKWVESEGIQNPTINSVILCHYTGESC